jgi:hypothetical protein
MKKDSELDQRESYAHYLGRLTRNTVQGTVQLAQRAFNIGGRSLEYIMSPEVKIINTRQDHDERHRDLHYSYKRLTGQ